MIGSRRTFVSGLGLAAVAAAIGVGPGWMAASRALAAPAKPFTPALGPRSRVLYVNDLSGDIDGLFSAVHAMLSPSIDLCGIVGTGTGSVKETAKASAALAREMLRLTGRGDAVPVFEGADHKLIAAGQPMPSAGTQAIIREALRTDTKLPLTVAVGGGLTEVASALMLAPAIASRFTLVWIGGDPYPAGGAEYNFMVDHLAAQYVFNETAVPIWQVTSGAYGMCTVSDTELQANVAPCGAIGAWLYAKLLEETAALGKLTLNTGESYTLGDSPLVLLTALNDWIPSGRSMPMRYERTGSSPFDEVFAPRIMPDGTYQLRTDGRKIRVYNRVDTRMMFDDFYAKLRMNSAGA